MIAAMSPLQIGHPISPNLSLSDLGAEFELADSDLAPAELMRLLEEIDTLQLTGLLAPAPGADFLLRSGSRILISDQRSRLIYSRARHLFRTEMPGVGWSCAQGDLGYAAASDDFSQACRRRVAGRRGDKPIILEDRRVRRCRSANLLIVQGVPQPCEPDNWQHDRRRLVRLRPRRVSAPRQE